MSPGRAASLKEAGSALPPNADRYEWEGWPLERCGYDGEFDSAARHRMVEGGRALRRHLRRHRGQTGKLILEIGPFFNPLATQELFPGATIFYWDNDPNVLRWLKTEGSKHAIPCDLSEVDDPSFLAPTGARLRELTGADRNFDTILVSQVFNYTDYRALLRVLPGILEPEGILFVNNVVDYGLPIHFSEHQPESIEATLAAIERSGFHLVAHEIIPSSVPDKQKHPRLVAAARLRRRGESDPIRAAGAVTDAFSRYLSAERGFLPSYVPHSTLPVRFVHYTEALDLLPATYGRDLGGVRGWMDERFGDFDPGLLPEIATLNDREQHELLVVLSILAHTYRWNSVPAPPSAHETKTVRFPAGIEKPFYFLTDLLDHPRCGTLWSTTSSNWKMKARRGGESYRNEEVIMENLQIAHSWFPSPMHEQLEGWVLIFTVMEARGAPVIRVRRADRSGVSGGCPAEYRPVSERLRQPEPNDEGVSPRGPLPEPGQEPVAGMGSAHVHLGSGIRIRGTARRRQWVATRGRAVCGHRVGGGRGERDGQSGRRVEEVHAQTPPAVPCRARRGEKRGPGFRDGEQKQRARAPVQRLHRHHGSVPDQPPGTGRGVHPRRRFAEDDHEHRSFPIGRRECRSGVQRGNGGAPPRNHAKPAVTFARKEICLGTHA